MPVYSVLKSLNTCSSIGSTTNIKIATNMYTNIDAISAGQGEYLTPRDVSGLRYSSGGEGMGGGRFTAWSWVVAP